MARRKARVPQGKKLQPAVKTMKFKLPKPEGAAFGNATIDLSQCASLLNRRFYRQGLNWAVGGFTLQGFAGVSAYVEISKIPDTWVASNAWEKGFRAWDKMNREALQEAESTKARFTDFKVYMDQDHLDAGVAANLLPFDNATTGTDQQAVAGEWEMSQFMVPEVIDAALDPTNTSMPMDVIWVGENFNGAADRVVSLIQGYANSRALPSITDPNVPDDADDTDGSTPENWLSAIFNEGNEQTGDVLAIVTEENNEPPYPYENDGTHTSTMYPGGADQLPNLELHYPMQIAPTTVSGLNTAPGGNFQGGLIRVQYSIAVTDPSIEAECMLLVHLVPGHHRGYLCESMQDV